jgi:hypothetical protein
VNQQRIKLQKECRAARTSKRTVEGGAEGEPPAQRARSLASSSSVTLDNTPLGGTSGPFSVHGDAGQVSGRRASGGRTPRTGSAQYINAAALPSFQPPKMERPSSQWYANNIEQDILNQLPDGEGFRNMVVNFHQGRGNNRFRVPNFGGVEADLTSLFEEVLVRGGSATISEHKLWREVVRTCPLTSTSRVQERKKHTDTCSVVIEFGA